jgi:hypothetical protein
MHEIETVVEYVAERRIGIGEAGQLSVDRVEQTQ